MRPIRLFRAFYKKIWQIAVLAALLPGPAAAMVSAAAASTPAAAFPDKYAAIVIDANSGRVLFADRADSRRYPASLTKMMTLYLLFDAMKAGRITAQTGIPVSAYANGQPPTKLNLGAGQRIGAEDAAKALITKSANDIAVAIAEYLGGSEKNFARMMTTKARQLGMRNTNFANASGLPNLQNYSTARDLAVLALALRRNFPQQYALFSTTAFVRHGHVIRGHNRLVANMAGVDGIKTGYTRMSGFNLASSRRMGNKSIVGVVMGGKTSALRDSHMAGLLTRYMDKASGKKRFTLMPPDSPSLPAENDLLSRGAGGTAAAAATVLAAGIPIPTAKAVFDAALPSSADAAALGGGTDEPEGEDGAAADIPQQAIAARMSDRERDSALLMVLASQSVGAMRQTPAAQGADKTAPEAAPSPANKTEQPSVDTVITASLPAAAARRGKAAKKGWVIQLAAGRNAKAAERILAKTRGAVRRHYPAAEPYTEKFVKRGHAYYRVRFRGFPTKAAARSACARLKNAGYQCLAAAS